MKLTLEECFKEMYEEALVDVKRRFEKEALTEREVWQELRKYVDEFEGHYRKYEFFCEEAPIWDEFFNLVMNKLGVEIKRVELFAEFSDVKIPINVKLYGYPRYFEAKIEALRKNPSYLVKQDSLRP
jgi:hypothetical protein